VSGPGSCEVTVLLCESLKRLLVYNVISLDIKFVSAIVCSGKKIFSHTHLEDIFMTDSTLPVPMAISLISCMPHIIFCDLNIAFLAL